MRGRVIETDCRPLAASSCNERHTHTLVRRMQTHHTPLPHSTIEQTLPPSYVRFIRRQGAKELFVWDSIRVRACAAG